MPFLFPTARTSSSPEEGWTAAFNQLSQHIRQHFIRPEAHQRALASIQGLMSDASRKSAWQVAEAMGEAAPYAIQHVLNRAKWDCHGVRDEVRASVQETLASPNAVLVIDETGFLKKGRKSVGVQRQYSGTAGRIENCQIGVFRGCREPAWTCLGGSGIVSAQELGRRPGTLPSSACARRSALRDETGAGVAYIGTHPGY